METDFSNNFNNDIALSPNRLKFLKTICILSFVASGALIIIYLLGAMLLVIGEESASAAMDKILESYPNIQVDNPAEFLAEIGKVCLMCLAANIISLIGVIMMWNLNRIGFFVYVIAELSTNFFGLDINASANESTSYSGMVINIIIDLVFITLYAINLKHMNKHKTPIA